MIDFADDLAAMLDPDNFASAASYTAVGGKAKAIDVLLDEPHTRAELGDLDVIAQGFRAHLRAADVAAPAVGDALTIGARTWKVKRKELDLTGTLWTLDLEIQ